jgi:1-deoxy-D-xylulose-5-phosphate synthase
LQRAYDQVVHDVAIQKLPVRFAIDRAGQVGADGPTHAGSFDIAFLSCLPNFIVMAAGDEQELRNMVKTSILIDDRPSSFRYPRGSCYGLDISKEPEPLDIGKGRIIQEGNKIALINFGARLVACREAAQNLLKKGIKITLIDARFAKPLDTKLIDKVIDNHEYVITIEEGSIGGFSSIVLDYIHNKRSMKTNSKINNLIFPDIFVQHDTPENQYKSIGMDSKSIEEKILNFFQKKIVHLKKIHTL